MTPIGNWARNYLYGLSGRLKEPAVGQANGSDLHTYPQLLFRPRASEADRKSRSVGRQHPERCYDGFMRILAVALSLLAAVPSIAVSQEAVTGQASIVDGDTLEIRGVRIRLFGIDAPESAQTCHDDDGKLYRCGIKVTPRTLPALPACKMPLYNELIAHA
jgi:endonuclease YncB( thermonuclease family)